MIFFSHFWRRGLGTRYPFFGDLVWFSDCVQRGELTEFFGHVVDGLHEALLSLS